MGPGRPRAAKLTMKGEGGVAVADGIVYAGYDDGFSYVCVLKMVPLRGPKFSWQAKFVDVDSRPLSLETFFCIYIWTLLPGP